MDNYFKDWLAELHVLQASFVKHKYLSYVQINKIKNDAHIIRNMLPNRCLRNIYPHVVIKWWIEAASRGGSWSSWLWL